MGLANDLRPEREREASHNACHQSMTFSNCGCLVGVGSSGDRTETAGPCGEIGAILRADTQSASDPAKCTGLAGVQCQDRTDSLGDYALGRAAPYGVEEAMAPGGWHDHEVNM